MGQFSAIGRCPRLAYHRRRYALKGQHIFAHKEQKELLLRYPRLKPFLGETCKTTP